MREDYLWKAAGLKLRMAVLELEAIRDLRGEFADGGPELDEELAEALWRLDKILYGDLMNDKFFAV